MHAMIFPQAQLSSYLEDTYELWQCDSGVDCEGACLASVEMSRDVITSGSTSVSPLVSTRRSNIIGLMMLNPETDAFIPLNMSTNGTILFDIHISGSVNESAYMLQVCSIIKY